MAAGTRWRWHSALEPWSFGSGMRAALASSVWSLVPWLQVPRLQVPQPQWPLGLLGSTLSIWVAGPLQAASRMCMWKGTFCCLRNSMEMCCWVASAGNHVNLCPVPMEGPAWTCGLTSAATAQDLTVGPHALMVRVSRWGVASVLGP